MKLMSNYENDNVYFYHDNLWCTFSLSIIENRAKKSEKRSKSLSKFLREQITETLGQFIIVSILGEDAVDARAGSRHRSRGRAGLLSNKGHAGDERAQLLRGEESLNKMVAGVNGDLVVDDWADFEGVCRDFGDDFEGVLIYLEL